jgi:hypothetical protein
MGAQIKNNPQLAVGDYFPQNGSWALFFHITAKQRMTPRCFTRKLIGA